MALKAQTISEPASTGTGWKIFGGAFLLGGIAAAAAGGGGGNGRNKETAENPPPSPQPNPPVSAKTDIFYSTGKSQTVSGSLKQPFDAANLEEKSQILKDEHSILARYTNVKTQAAIDKNIEAAYSPDSDKDGVIDAFDKNPNTWDVSERDLRMFSSLAYAKEEQINQFITAVNSPNDPASQKLLADFYATDNVQNKSSLNFNGQAQLEELLKDWEVLKFYNGSDVPILGTGLDFTLFGNGKKSDGTYENVVIAFRGSSNIADFISNGAIWSGMIPEQAKDTEIILKYLEEYQPNKIYATGHSLGGYNTQYFVSHYLLNSKFKDNFVHSAIFNPAILKTRWYSRGILETAREVTDKLLATDYTDDTDKTETITKQKTNSYVVVGDWVDGKLGSYEGTTWIDEKNAISFALENHALISFSQKDEKLKQIFSKGYRIDKHYLNDDTDKDGFTDFQEKRIGTDFRTATKLNGKDTDKDGFSDHLEIKLGSDWQNADKVVEVSEFVKRSEWDKPLFAVAASHTEDGKNEFLGAKGFMLAPTAKGNELTFKADGDGFDLNISASEWQTWLDAGKHIIGGSHEADTLSGSDMASMVFGGKGEDILQAGAAQTVLVGGEGNDTFMFTASNLLSGSLNIINDLSTGDKLDFSGALTLFADRGNAFKWSDVLGESVAAFDNASALIWQDESNTLAYKSGSSNDMHVFARFDDSQNLASIQAALLG